MITSIPKTMNIYVHTPREWFELYQLGKRQFGCFIGHTSRDVLEERFDDGDYSHFIEVPQVLRKYEGLHEEITDHWIHDEVIAEGWHQYNKLCKEGRSPDFFVTDKDPETALSVIDRAVERVRAYWDNYIEQYGESPAKVKKKTRHRLQDYHRMVKKNVMDGIYDTHLSHLPKDAKIAVIRDAHGRISEYLIGLGFTNITTDEQINSLHQEVLGNITIVEELNEMFDVVIGNPPYNEGLYAKFVKKIPEILKPDGTFSLLLPSYTFTRKTSAKYLKNDVCLTHVDMTCGEAFPSISGTWVARFDGTTGRTGDKSFTVKLPNGNTVETSFNELFPTSEKFIGPNGLVEDDISIVRKVLNGTINYNSHKETELNASNLVYLRPTLKYIGKPSPAAGAFTLNIVSNRWDSTMANGCYLYAPNADRVKNIYAESKLFVFVHWLMTSDFPMVAESYIDLLPDVTQMTYKNESDLYEQFGLSDSEIQRIESIFP